MICLFSGGSGSGKSELAEKCAVNLWNKSGKKSEKNSGGLYYYATMRVWDREGELRVEKHRKQRAGRGFITEECPSRLNTQITDSVILLECLSNRLANSMFSDKDENPEGLILNEIYTLSERNSVVIVTNEIFSDGVEYDPDTERYRMLLGRLNCKLCRKAELVVESVYGIPVVHKGEWI